MPITPARDSTPEHGRPNIVWLVSEDCPPRFGAYGDPHARTPHLDRLARTGVTFEHAFSAAPVCAPARFGLLTGIPPEADSPAQQMRASATLPDGLRTYPETLRGLGYYVTNNNKTDYNARIDPAEIWDESSPHAHWRNRPADKPFLAVFNFNGTHESSIFNRDDPSTDPEDLRLPAYLPDTPQIRTDFATYYDRIAEFDDFVGQILEQLADDGLSEDTIIIQTSDHGGVNPRSKRFLYDEGLHVPLIITAPPRFADRFPDPGTRIEAAVSTLSIPSTLIELAGGSPPDRFDEPRQPSLARRHIPADSLAFSGRDRMDERYDLSRTVRDSRFRYIRNFNPHRPWGQHYGFAWNALGYQSWEREHLAGRLNPTQDAFWGPKAGIELYDVDADPDEVHNLAGDPRYADVERRLSTALHDHILAIHDNGFLPEGSPHEGLDPSREPGVYPLARILDTAEAVTQQSPAHLPRFLDDLDDPDATVRRWAAIGILTLASAAGADPATQIGDAVTERLTRLLAEETEPTVVVHAAEALARLTGDPHATAALAVLTQRRDVPLRLEALNALTALHANRVAPHLDVVEAVADDDNEYIRGAGRYLLFRLQGRYEPGSPVFVWERFTLPSHATHGTPRRPATPAQETRA